jgi:hypothetical protein
MLLPSRGHIPAHWKSVTSTGMNSLFSSRIRRTNPDPGNGCPLLKLTAKIHYNKMPAPSSDVKILQIHRAARGGTRLTE